MAVYDPNEFIKAFRNKTNGKEIPACPFCGNRQYTSTDSLATILIAKEERNINIGPTIPSGMLICQKCGHIDFFALGVLGLIKNEGGQENAKQSEQK